MILDDGDRIFRLDPTTWMVPTIDAGHKEIHEQNGYILVHSELADTAGDFEIRMEISVLPKRPHMLIHFDSALASTVEMWVSTTKTDVVNNRLTPMNRDDESDNTSLLTFCHTPGGAQAGDANLLQYLGSASASGRSDAGGTGGGRAEFKWARGRSYLFRMTSRVDGNAMTMLLDWYEHTDKE